MIFDEYIRKSSCNLNDCPYGYDVSCVKCHQRMIEEHDASVRAEAIEECVKKLEVYKTNLDPMDWMIVNQCIVYLERLKEKKK